MSDLEKAKRLLGEAQELMYVDEPPGKNEIAAYQKITEALALLDKVEVPVTDDADWDGKVAPGKWFLGCVVPACCGQPMKYVERVTGWDHICEECGKKRLWYHEWNPYCTYQEPPAKKRIRGSMMKRREPPAEEPECHYHKGSHIFAHIAHPEVLVCKCGAVKYPGPIEPEKWRGECDHIHQVISTRCEDCNMLLSIEDRHVGSPEPRGIETSVKEPEKRTVSSETDIIDKSIDLSLEDEKMANCEWCGIEVADPDPEVFPDGALSFCSTECWDKFHDIEEDE